MSSLNESTSSYPVYYNSNGDQQQSTAPPGQVVDSQTNSAMASPSQNSPMGQGGTTNQNTSTSKLSNSDNQTPILTKPRLQELVREVDPTEQLDEEVEELLLQIADDFVEDTVKAACSFAKHRKVSRIEVRDVQLHLERKWNMWLPGFGTDELRPYKRATVTEAHKQRLALIRKTIKKY